MANVFMPQRHLPWLLWLLCCTILVATAFSDTDPGRHHYRKKNKNNAGRDHRIHNKNTKYSSSQMTHKAYKDRLRFQEPRGDQTTVLPEFLPDGPRPKMPDPSFMPEQAFVEVRQGDLAILPCTVQYLGARQISWQKLGTEHFLSIGTDIWVKNSNLRIDHRVMPAGASNWNLVFHEAGMEDSGEYECRLISTEELTWTVELSVLEKPPFNPEISVEGKEFVESGTNVYLRCNTTNGDSIPEDVDWFKDGDKIEASRFPNVLITKFRSKESMTLISELMISNSHSLDSGTYICRSSNRLIASVEVNVLVADSANVKRGTGTSSTRIQSVSGNHNVGSSVMRRYFPYFFGHPLVFLVSLLVPLLV